MGVITPTPVWPGSGQTALLFVGLPLLMAVVLMAAPLHDATPPSGRDGAAAALVEEPALVEPLITVPERQAAVSRPRRVERDSVSAVIFETRRTIRASRETPRVAQRAPRPVAGTTHPWLRRPLPPAPRSLAAVVARANLRPTSSEPQSP